MAARTKPASGAKQGAGTKPNASETKDGTAALPKESGQLAAALTTDPSRSESSESGFEALEQDHRRVEQLFSDYESAMEDVRKDELVQQICIELTIHAQLEEEIFYPACREKFPEEDMLDEAQVEHDSAKLLIADLMEARSGDRFRDAKVSVLREQVKHHVGEEEMPGTGIIAQARAHGVDAADLARRLKERKRTLQRRAAELRPTRAISLNLDLDTFTDLEGRMARNSGSGERERDERGRFVSDDDDDRDYRRSASRGGGRRDDDDDDRRGSRSRGRDDDDDRGGRGRGGWFGDSEGHREAARRRFDDDDDRRGGSRSRGRDDEMTTTVAAGAAEAGSVTQKATARPPGGASRMTMTAAAAHALAGATTMMIAVQSVAGTMTMIAGVRSRVVGTMTMIAGARGDATTTMTAARARAHATMTTTIVADEAAAAGSATPKDMPRRPVGGGKTREAAAHARAAAMTTTTTGGRVRAAARTKVTAAGSATRVVTRRPRGVAGKVAASSSKADGPPQGGPSGFSSTAETQLSMNIHAGDHHGRPLLPHPTRPATRATVTRRTSAPSPRRTTHAAS